ASDRGPAPVPNWLNTPGAGPPLRRAILRCEAAMSDLPPPAPSVETPSGAPATTTPPPPARRSRRWLVLAGLVVVAAVGLAGWRYAVTRPDYLYRQARRILEEQARREPKDRDYNRVWEIAERL